jgi:hypothetical protein
MARDYNDNELNVGDPVIIRGTVRAVMPGDNRYNILVDTDEFLFPETIKSAFHLNGKQVELATPPVVEKPVIPAEEAEEEAAKEV